MFLKCCHHLVIASHKYHNKPKGTIDFSYIDIYIYTYIHTYIHTCIIYTVVYIKHLYIYIYIYILYIYKTYIYIYYIYLYIFIYVCVKEMDQLYHYNINGCGEILNYKGLRLIRLINLQRDLKS